jgi:hypothetical protein
MSFSVAAKDAQELVLPTFSSSPHYFMRYTSYYWFEETLEPFSSHLACLPCLTFSSSL